jgi:hypothetical protein
MQWRAAKDEKKKIHEKKKDQNDPYFVSSSLTQSVCYKLVFLLLICIVLSFEQLLSIINHP